MVARVSYRALLMDIYAMTRQYWYIIRLPISVAFCQMKQLFLASLLNRFDNRIGFVLSWAPLRVKHDKAAKPRSDNRMMKENKSLLVRNVFVHSWALLRAEQLFVPTSLSCFEQ